MNYIIIILERLIDLNSFYIGKPYLDNTNIFYKINGEIKYN